MHLRSDNFAHGSAIPAEFAFGKIGDPVALSSNVSPHLAWRDAPDGTRSFALTCIDADAPGQPDNVNKPGRIVSADLPRVEFVHWLMADIPPECGELVAGSCCDGVTPHGKAAPLGPPGSVQGLNDYTGWFAGDAEMEGIYLGYDGPCPPWNDARLHHYHFHLYAVDVPSLSLNSGFDLHALRKAIAGHVLAHAEWMGIYSLNPVLQVS